MKKRKIFFLISSIFLVSCENEELLDAKLSTIIKQQSLEPLPKVENNNPELFKLGQALFFDKILSGNKDISCATCHHPQFGTVDCLSLGAGTKGQGLCKDREKAEGREFVPRNSPELFNKGLSLWHAMFWDGRIELQENGQIRTPAGKDTPEGLINVLAAQALFPITSRTEMRGLKGDIAVDGTKNELAEIEDGKFVEIWDKVMDRILSIQEYVQMFEKAYPGKTQFTIADYANAVATYEGVAFSMGNTPWDEYLRGNKKALKYEAKLGAVLFYGKAGCYQCHSGPLFTDQKYHNIGVPQFGPGKDTQTGLDMGRYHVTGNPDDKYKFRTPSLRNLLVTAPYLHNGAYDSLEKVIKHHMNPEKYLRQYNPLENGIPEDLAKTLKNDEQTINDILSTLDINIPQLTDEEISYLVEFLKALTSPDVYNEEKMESTIPERVPSGLPIDRI